MHMFLFKKDECITKTVVPETNSWRLFLGYWNSSDEAYGFWELQKVLRCDCGCFLLCVAHCRAVWCLVQFLLLN